MLDASVGTSTANSYLTRDEATQILTVNRLWGATWADSTDEKKDAALIWATSLIDTAFDFYGYIRHLDQSLRWPRTGVIDRDERSVDYDTIPKQVKEATAELALVLLKRDRTVEPAALGKGVKSVTVGPLSITVDSEQVIDLIPESVRMKLYAFATQVTGQAKASFSVIDLRRS